MSPRNISHSLTFALCLLLSIITFSEAFATRPLSSLTQNRDITQEQSKQVSSSRISPLFASPNKSGGKIMKDAEMYQKTVLDASDDSKPILVFFSAPWCGPCRLTVPVISQIKQQFANEIEVVEVCTDDLAEISEKAGVVSIPTIQFYYQGKKVDTIVGCVAKSVLATTVSKVLEDVPEVASP